MKWRDVRSSTRAVVTAAPPRSQRASYRHSLALSCCGLSSAVAAGGPRAQCEGASTRTHTASRGVRNDGPGWTGGGGRLPVRIGPQEELNECRWRRRLPCGEAKGVWLTVYKNRASTDFMMPKSLATAASKTVSVNCLPHYHVELRCSYSLQPCAAPAAPP